MDKASKTSYTSQDTEGPMCDPKKSDPALMGLASGNSVLRKCTLVGCTVQDVDRGPLDSKW